MTLPSAGQSCSLAAAGLSRLRRDCTGAVPGRSKPSAGTSRAALVRRARERLQPPAAPILTLGRLRYERYCPVPCTAHTARCTARRTGHTPAAVARPAVGGSSGREESGGVRRHRPYITDRSRARSVAFFGLISGPPAPGPTRNGARVEWGSLGRGRVALLSLEAGCLALAGTARGTSRPLKAGRGRLYHSANCNLSWASARESSAVQWQKAPLAGCGGSPLARGGLHGHTRHRRRYLRAGAIPSAAE